MWKAIIHDKFTPNWCLIVVIGYSINKKIACSSVANRGRNEFKKPKWSLEKTDPGRSSCQMCIYYIRNGHS